MAVILANRSLKHFQDEVFLQPLKNPLAAKVKTVKRMNKTLWNCGCLDEKLPQLRIK